MLLHLTPRISAYFLQLGAKMGTIFQSPTGWTCERFVANIKPRLSSPGSI